MRATSLVGLPVVTTTTGEDIAETRDVIYVPDQGRVAGFTLNKRGRLAGRMKNVLAMEQVHAVGRDAVMVRDAAALDAPEGEAAAQDAKGRNVIGNRVLTDAGKELGVVRDLIVEMNRGGGHRLRARRRNRTAARGRCPAAASPSGDARRLQRNV